MRYAIVESGGKQYKAIEGQTIEVDRLAAEKGKQIELERILLMADGDEFMIGTPTVGGVQVKATVMDHLRGDKVVHFRYSPKKRIRVRGGHRQEYTRLMVDFIGKPGESRTLAPHASAGEVEKAERAKPESKAGGSAKGPAKEASTRKAEKTSGASSPKEKKSSASKKPSAATKKSSK